MFLFIFRIHAANTNKLLEETKGKCPGFGIWLIIYVLLMLISCFYLRIDQAVSRGSSVREEEGGAFVRQTVKEE